MRYKFIHLTDLHFNPLHRIPESRTAEFHSQIRAKWDYILNLHKNDPEIEGGFISGDIFHLKNPNLYYPEYMMYYADLFSSTGIKWYSIPGNHDLPSSSYDEIHRSPYYLLTKTTPNIVDCSLRTYKIIDNVYVTGLPYFPIEKTLSMLNDINTHISQYKGFNILLLHTDAMPSDDVKLFWQVTSYDEVLDRIPNVDLVLLGHIHMSFPVYKRNIGGKTQMISKPWSFSRVIKDYFNKTDILSHLHKPSYSIIIFDINSEKFTVNIEYKEIPFAPFEDAFKPESIKRQAETSTKLVNFMKSLQDGVNTKYKLEDPDEYVKKAEIPDKVRDLIFYYLGED